MTPPSPLRVAVIGSGPAAFFTADHLLKKTDIDITVDMIERLPAPFGLVRFGVAPDHEKIKNVTKQFDRTARKDGFRFFGNVDVGTDVLLADLARHYDMVCYATGAQTDRRLGIPGEDLARSHPATEFVAWYNGHPEFQDREFDLSVERVAVIGVGNVAVDVARMLCRTDAELGTTDITERAQRAIAASGIREVYMIGRRGPAQAAFTNPEVRELGELEGADVRLVPEEIALDPLSRATVERSDDRALRKKLEILDTLAQRAPSGKARTLHLRFLLSPVELVGNDRGEVARMRLVRNRLEQDGDRLRAVSTDVHEELPVQLVFRSVGYRGVAIPDLPFNEKWGTVPNQAGRVLSDTGEPVRGVYVSGWIKRGPSGVIGTNKPDAAETVGTMLADAAAGAMLAPADRDPAAAAAMIFERQPKAITYDDWLRIDEAETANGKAEGRPRIKFTTIGRMLSVVGR